MQYKPHAPQRLKPVALAAGLLLGVQPAMPATVNWVGPNASFWDLLSNWSSGVLPGSADDLDLAGFDTSFRSGTMGVRSFNGSGRLSLTGGRLSVSHNSFIGLLTLGGGVLAGAGDLTVSGAATFSGGQMLGTGTTVLNGLATVSSLDLDEGRSLQAKGGLSFAASASIDLNPNYTDSTAHGRLVNAATSTLTDNGGLSVYASNYGGNDNGANARFVNAGTFNKGGAATSVISVGFENSGSVNVNQGTLRLSGGSTHTGGSVGGAGQLQFSGGTHSFNAASSINTANVLFSSGTVTINGSYNVSGTSTFSGGEVTLPGVITSLGQNLVVNGGTANLGANNISVDALNLSSGSIRGTGSLTVPSGGTASITGGQMLGTGTTFINTALSLSSLALDEGRTLQANAGLAFAASASIDLNPNYTDSTAHGRLVNAATSTLTDNGGLSVYASNYGGNENGANARFVNAGTYNKGGATTSVISVGFDNSGTVNVNQGTLRLSGGSTHTGATVGGAGQLQFSGGTHSFNAASTLSTADVLFSSGSVTINGSYNVSGTSTFSGGEVTLPGVITSLGQTLVVNGGTANLGANNISVNSLSLSSGSIRGTGSLTVPSGGTASLTGGQMLGTGTTFINTALSLGSLALDEGRTLQANAGLAFAASASIDLNPNYTDSTAHGRLVNAATSTLTDNGGLSVYASNYGGNENGANARFVNAGTYNKGGAAASVISVGFDNSGSVNVNQGTLRLSGGSTHTGATVGGAGQLQFSGGTHSFNAASTLSTADVLFSSGTVTIGGTYNVAGTSTFRGGDVTLPGVITSLGQNLVVNGGTANLGVNNISVDSLNLSSGSIRGTGSLTVPSGGTASITGGQMLGTGTTFINTALSLSSLALDEGRTLQASAGLTFAASASIDLNPNYTDSTAHGRLVNAATSTLTDNGGLSVYASNYGGNENGANARFVNAGTYNKGGAAASVISVGFDNSGTVNVNQGTLRLSGSGAHSGSFAVAAGATLDLSNGTHALTHAAGPTGSGRLLISGATVNLAGSLDLAGLVDQSGGSFNLGGGNHQAGSLTLRGGVLSGTGELRVAGDTTFSGGQMLDAGTTRTQGAVNISSLQLDTGRTLQIEGGATLAAGAGINLNPNYTDSTVHGRLVNAAGSTVTDNGGVSITVSNYGGNENGANARFVNAGIYDKTGAVASTIATTFENTGTLRASNGTLTLSGALANLSGTTLTGGNFEVIGNSTLRIANGNIVSNAATLLLDGANAALINGSTGLNGLSNFATNAAAGRFTIRNGRNFSSAGAFSNAGIVQVGSGSTFTGGGSFGNGAGSQLQMAGGSFAGPALVNAGSVNGFGAVHTLVQNSGSVLASGGTLATHAGIQGAGGSVSVAGGATLDLSSSAVASSAGTLLNQGTLNLGAQALQVHADYDNTGFGSGNSFAARSGVLGGGAIVGVNAALALTGDVSSPAANQYLIDFGAVREGTTVTRSFQVANSGTGASVRGALQNAANGASLTDARLSGSGTQAGNFGLLAAGTSSGNYSITLTGNGTGGNLLPDQSLAVVSNFDNVALQSVQLTGLSTVLARGSAAPAGPVNLGNFRVGIAPELQASLDVTNTTTGAGAERLGVGSVATSGNFSAVNALGSGLVAPGASSAAAVAVSTQAGVVGANNGSVTLQFVSDGRDFDPSFTAIASNQQTVDLLATGFLVAQPATPAVPVNVGNYRLVNGASSSFAVTNTNLAPAGLQEVLNATAGPGTAGVTFSGAINGLAPGASSNAMVIGFAAGGAAGVRNGSATLNLVSDGTGTSGLGLYDLAPATVQVTGTAFHLAGGTTAPTPVTVANQRVGDSARAALTVSNTGPAGLFTEALNASFAASSGAATPFGSGITDLAAASSDSLSLGVGVDSATAGHKTGSVTLAYLSDGTGANGRSGLAAVSVGQQTIDVSGDVYRLATSSTASPNPVVLANQRVGGVLTQAITLNNTAATDGFSEGLNASISASGSATAGGSFSVLAAGASSGALFVGLDTSTAGAKGGTAAITLASDGTGTSGFGALGIGTQTFSVSGNVYRLAQANGATPNPVVFANQRVGDSGAVALSITNTAAADGFSEALNASLSGNGNVLASGSFNLLAAGNTDNTSLLVSLDTSSAGARSGTATLTLTSDGTGSSGLGTFGLGTQTVTVNGGVYRLASASAASPSPVVLANQRVGGSLTQAITLANSAAADGFSESLNASISASGTATAGGSFSLLAAGNSSSALFVGVDTSTAGAKSGTATLTLASDGTGTSGFAALGIAGQQISVSGNVYRLASASAASPSPVVLANQRVGGSLTQAITLANTAAADGFSEGLNGSISASGTATAGGSFSLLAAGNSSSALWVGVDTGTAGAKSGTATLTLASDGTGTSGFAALGIAGQQIGVSGDVYRLAMPVVNTAPITLVARVGDIAPSSTINVANSGADAYTERLNASIASVPAGWAASGSVNGLATGQNSNALTLALNTTVAGSFAGSAGVALVSSGAGTTLAPDADLGAANVALTGRVYAPAVAQLPISTINFGIVRVGDVVPSRNVAVANAATGALTDTLGASIATLPGNGFVASGTVSGLAAGSSDTHTLNVGLDTASAGVFSGAATVGFASSNPELADLALGTQEVLLQGQVNRLAEVGLAQAGGSGSLAGAGTQFTLSFGTLALGADSLLAWLDLSNVALAPADNLAGGFDLSGITAGSPFTLGGFGSIDIAAGSTLSGLTVSFASGAAGVFDEVIVLRGLSSNGSGPDLHLADVQLHLTGTVVAVPEPGTYLLMAGGLLMLARVTRRRSLKRAT